MIAEVKPTDLSGWSLKWQRVKNLITEDIDTSGEKFRGSKDRQLVIHSMCKKDEGNYQAVLTRDIGGNYQIISKAFILKCMRGNFIIVIFNGIFSLYNSILLLVRCVTD